ncbi:Site-specific recombinase XerD [Catalinimonas alkaloidigena]|uniref:Site-specific recombinase XerD n=1 Tax=Catalinimonas alkaloidigena TaxID=1075417 RepID=A0A1G9AEH4_9BACT|nr:site-specific integrase [Catalinimonas alkaloidigena]SDK25757.1 Site-specific recombinase XerD [Catalinimonas alkaloidigena]
MASVKVVRKANKVDEFGKAPLYLRIIKDRKAKFIALSIKVLEEEWDEKTQQVVKIKGLKGREMRLKVQRYNKAIFKKRSDAEDVALDLETTSKYVAPKKIKEAIMGKSSESFLKYAHRYINSLEKAGKIGTWDKARTVISKLETYLGKKDLLFDDVTVSFLKRYETYLKEDLGNSVNTVYSNIKIIKKLFSDAVTEDVISIEKNPFLRHKLKTEKTTKEYLTEEDLQAIDALLLKSGSKKHHRRNMYIFCCWAGGIRISDVLQLQWLNFDGEKITLTMHKTGDVVSIKLPTRAIQILEEYKHPNTKSTDYIFPFLRNDLDYSDPKVLYKAIQTASNHANKSLKHIAKEAGIDKKLTFHTSRHTFATRALRKGMRIEYVSKLLGHTSVKTTQIYAKVVNEELDKAMDVFN